MPEREIFCFFPHNFTEYSPSGAWIRQGDWKLIEVFYISDLWPEKHLLYNLKEDIGETTNLAAKHPERAAAMAAKLEAHYMTLCDRPPKPNPDFNPATLPVGGWMTQGSGELKMMDAGLTVSSPGIRTRDLPRETGVFSLHWKMRTKRRGDCRVYWSDMAKRPYDADRRMDVPILSDEDWSEYKVSFGTSSPLYGLRIDFGSDVDPVDIIFVKLCAGDGRVLAEWAFDVSKRAIQ
jgi:hypothetical protein